MYGWSRIKRGAKSLATGGASNLVGAGKSLAKGDLRGALDHSIGAATFGGSDLAIGAGQAVKDGVVNGSQALVNGYNKPYDDARSANEDAAGEMEQVGQTAAGMQQAGLGRALDQTTPAARQWHNTYEGEGSLAGPGAAEQRYTNRLNGTDVNANLQRETGAKAINDQFAARGLNNSGAAMKANAMMNAKVTADSQGQMDQLAQGAQGAAETRLGGAFDRISGLGAQRAGIVQNGTNAATDAYTSGQMGGINGRLAAANVGVSQRKDLMNLGGQLGGALTGALV